MFSKYIHELKNTDLFENIPPSHIFCILEHLSASLKIYKAGEIICHEGSPFHHLGIIVSGKLQNKKTYLTGECLTLNILEASQSFGEENVCTQLPAPYTLCALAETTVIFMDGTDLLFMDQDSYPFMGTFLANMMKLIASRSLDRQTQGNFARITSLKRRTAAFLLEHYKQTGQCLFTIQQNRCEMAAYLNATRPALSKVLAELKKETIIDYYKDSFKIEDVEALMHVAI